MAIIVDPAPDSFENIKKYLESEGLTPVAVILTHSHWDHIGDAEKVKNYFNIPVMIHERDSGNLEKPGSDGLPCWMAIPGVKADRFLKEGDEIVVGEISFKVIETPGHTPGGICLYSEKEKCLIAGDTLFKQSIGNLSFPTARPNEMWLSLDKLAQLPKDTAVYPGHGPSTTIGEESWLPNARQIFE